MKRAARLLMALAWAASLLSVSAVAGPFHGGGRNGGGFGGGGRPGGMERREDPRQQMPPPQRPTGRENGGDPGRMSPAERQQLRDQIREHGQAYRERDRGRQ
jgi:hypothetical protein